MNDAPDVWSQLTPQLRSASEAQLIAGESIVSAFLADLDSRLQFAETLVVLTDRRILSTPLSPARTPTDWTAWALGDVTSIVTRDRGGLATLDLLGGSALLSTWPHTIAQAGAARDLADAFDDQRTGRSRQTGTGEWAEEPPEAEEPEPPANVGSLFRLLKFARAHAGMLTLGLILTMSSTSAGLIPYSMTIPILREVLDPFEERGKEVRDNANLSAEQQELQLIKIREESRPSFIRIGWYLTLFAVAAIASWILAWAQGWTLARVSERISADLRNATYEHLHKLSLEFFGAKRTGDLVARISNDTDRICAFLSDSLVDFISDVLMIVGTTIVLFQINSLLAIATLSTFPVIAWLTFLLRDRLTHGFLHGGRAWGDMTSILADTIPGIRVVKAFAQERREIERFRNANQRIIDANDRVNRVWTFFWPLVAFLNQIGLLVVWAFGAYEIYNNRIDIAALMAVFQYTGRIYGRLESMSRMATSTQRAAASAQRLFEILDRVPSVPEPAQPVHPGKLHGQIELSNISFRFGSRQIIDGVSLSIRQGEMIGLVGTTGAGKSTLVNLVCRFYDVTEGAVLVDGKDVRSFPVSDYRQNIGIVLQEPFLFYGTISDNIAYGKPDATREEIITAAKAARAHEFILQLADGYDSIVGERGQTLSGGERQRISIARALLIDPRILILDEATSSVDTETERQIQEALDNLVRGRTTIAIAHRLSTLRKADRLVVLSRGRIVEVGNHADLLAAGGTYAHLYQAQMQLAQDSDAQPEPLPEQEVFDDEESL